ncbi:DUF7659 family protein [Poseidonibacter ostreae]|uniref:Uncharacterized protein n=1 Tax=Poseidonibacter ostreae TaxID=2654171 RepID=A0A6L4WX17_9BACT|nr:hypothetical protein [Poseidonibacter ostreae]KAB7891417.1 hypothetical protein GBG19_00850 [Poseidonibacter ostreae]
MSALPIVRDLEEILGEHGAFFAFGQEQFDKAKIDGVKYVSLGSGLVSPKENAKELLKNIEENSKNKIELEMKTLGANKIIRNALFNYECQISCSYEDAMESLSAYPITEEEIAIEYRAFMNHCIDNDLF